jgi:hypothetical protein
MAMSDVPSFLGVLILICISAVATCAFSASVLRKNTCAQICARVACLAALAFVNACCGLNPAFVNAWLRGSWCECVSLIAVTIRQSFGFFEERTLATVAGCRARIRR